MRRSIFPWAAKHPVWVLKRFLIHDDGLRSFHRRCGKGHFQACRSSGRMSSSRHTPGTSPQTQTLHSAPASGSGGARSPECTWASPWQASSKQDHPEGAATRESTFRLVGGIQSGAFGPQGPSNPQASSCSRQPTSAQQTSSNSPEVEGSWMEVQAQDNRGAIILEQTIASSSHASVGSMVDPGGRESTSGRRSSMRRSRRATNGPAAGGRAGETFRFCEAQKESPARAAIPTSSESCWWPALPRTRTSR